jgi:hypothetical protein
MLIDLFIIYKAFMRVAGTQAVNYRDAAIPCRTSKAYRTTASRLKNWNKYIRYIISAWVRAFYFSSPSGPPPAVSFRPRKEPPSSRWLLPMWSRSPPV